MFRELFLLSKATYKKKALKSFFLFTFEVAAILFLNCGLFLFDEFGVRYPPYFLSALFAFLSVLLYCVFKAANVRFFFYESPNIRGAKRLFGSVFLQILLLLIKISVFVVCFLPFSGMAFLFVISLQSGFPLFALSATASFCVSLVFVGIFFYFRISPSFFLAPYIYLNDENATVFSSVEKSVLKTEGKTRLFLKIRKRLLPLGFLELFILPTGFVWGFKKRTLALFAYGLI